METEEAATPGRAAFDTVEKRVTPAQKRQAMTRAAYDFIDGIYLGMFLLWIVVLASSWTPS